MSHKAYIEGFNEAHSPDLQPVKFCNLKPGGEKGTKMTSSDEAIQEYQ